MITKLKAEDTNSSYGGTYDGAVAEVMRKRWLAGHRGSARVIVHTVTPFSDSHWPDNFVGITHYVRLESSCEK